jgi:hypothetical protein
MGKLYLVKGSGFAEKSQYGPQAGMKANNSGFSGAADKSRHAVDPISGPERGRKSIYSR